MRRISATKWCFAAICISSNGRQRVVDKRKLIAPRLDRIPSTGPSMVVAVAPFIPLGSPASGHLANAAHPICWRAAHRVPSMKAGQKFGRRQGDSGVFRACFRLVLIAAFAASAVFVAPTSVPAQSPPNGNGHGNGGGNGHGQQGGQWHGYQRRRDDWNWRGYDRWNNRFDQRQIPQSSSAWFQRPYPYHLDYYKMKWGGSYAPYFGNLYGTPFGTPQVVGNSGWGGGGPWGWGVDGYGFGSVGVGGPPVGFPGVPYSYSMMPQYPEQTDNANGQTVIEQPANSSSAAPAR